MKLNHVIAALVLSFSAAPALAANYTLAVEPNYPPPGVEEEEEAVGGIQVTADN